MMRPVFEEINNQESIGKEQLSTMDTDLHKKLEPFGNIHKYVELYLSLKHELKREIEERVKKREAWYKEKHTQMEKKEVCDQELQNAVKAKKNALYKSTKRVHGETIKSKKNELKKIEKEIKNCKSEIKKLTKEMQYLTGRRGEKWIDHSLLKYVGNTKIVADEKNTPGDDNLKKEVATENNIAAKDKVTTKELKLVTKELTEKQRKQQLKHNLQNLKALDQALKEIGNVKNPCFNPNEIDYYAKIRLNIKRAIQLDKNMRFRVSFVGRMVNLVSAGKVDKKRGKIERDLQMSWRDIYNYQQTNPKDVTQETAVKEIAQGKKTLTDLISKGQGEVHKTSDTLTDKGITFTPSAPPLMLFER